MNARASAVLKLKGEVSPWAPTLHWMGVDLLDLSASLVLRCGALVHGAPSQAGVG